MAEQLQYALLAQLWLACQVGTQHGNGPLQVPRLVAAEKCLAQHVVHRAVQCEGTFHVHDCAVIVAQFQGCPALQFGQRPIGAVLFFPAGIPQFLGDIARGDRRLEQGRVFHPLRQNGLDSAGVLGQHGREAGPGPFVALWGAGVPHLA